MIREQKSTIYLVCYMFSKDKAEVDDLVQEVLVNLWKGFGRFEGRSQVRTWVYRVSLNTCISRERKKKKSGTIPLAMDMDLFDESDSDNRQTAVLDGLLKQIDELTR